jgi:hypothetical protein
MKHFSMQDWIDFARQTKERSQAIAMQRHLDEGCTKCLKNLEAWRQVVDFANKEIAYAPPESSVRNVKASFALCKVTSLPAASFELARLVFDSAQEVVAAGVRGAFVSARQLLYKSGNLCIDMRMQPKPGSDSIVLFGQLLDSTTPAHGIGDVTVSLLSEGDMVSRKKTNDVGEFDFGFGALRHVQLVFGIGGRRALVVPVPDPEAEPGQPVM